MARLRREDRDAQLGALCDLGYGQAESESESKPDFVRRFFPVPEHLRAFETAVVLVVGDRGSGKSELFRAVFREGLWRELRGFAPGPRLPGPETASIEWLEVFPAEKEFSDARGLVRAIGEDDPPERAHDLWYAYTVRRLADHFGAEEREQLRPLLDPAAADPGPILTAFEKLGQAPLLALDRLDAEFEAKGAWLFLGYDELDTLGSYNWRGGLRVAGGLLRFWSSYSRRWRRLRAKIFLRTDLFRHFAGPVGPDFAKLAATRLELEWSDRNLWAVLVKRLANAGEGAPAEAFREAASRAMAFREHGEFGSIPELRSPEDAWPLIKYLAGDYMGANRRKGLTRRWLLDHLRDAHGKIAPRNLVRLIERAAEQERNTPTAPPSQLLGPASLRRALDGVSGDHVENAKREWPWLPGLKRLLEGTLLPMERKELTRKLRKGWDGGWGQDDKRDPVRPPAQDPADLIDYLCEVGVLKPRRDHRLNSPDLYRLDSPDLYRLDSPDLYRLGLGLLRKGGVSPKL